MRLTVTVELRVGRRRELGPEHRHPGTGLDLERSSEPVDDPLRLQPLARHAQVRRQVVGRLIDRDGIQHVALLTTQQFEQLFSLAGNVGSSQHRMRPELPDRVGDGTEVIDGRVPVRVVQTERRHADVEPRTDRDGILEEGVHPVRLHLGPLGRQQGRRERRIVHQLHVVAPVRLDLVTRDAVPPADEVAPVAQGVVPRRTRHLCGERLDVRLEAHDRRGEQRCFFLAHAEVGHPQFLERLQNAVLVERTWIPHLLLEPLDLRVRNVMDKREVEPRQQLGPLLGELDPDRLRILEPADLVATETTVAANHALPQFDLLFLGRKPSHQLLRLGGRQHRPDVVEQRLRHVRRGVGRLRRAAVRTRQRRQVGRDIRCLLIGKAQIRHVGIATEMAWITHPVEEPLVTGLVSDALQRLAERAARAGGEPVHVLRDVTREAADRVDQLFPPPRVPGRWRGHGEGMVVGVGEEVRHRGVDLHLVADRVLR